MRNQEINQKQVLLREVKDKFGVAQNYYKILSAINDLDLAKGEIQLVAFAAIKGEISSKAVRKEYCDMYGTTVATINNIVHRLKKKNIFHKKDNVIFVNPMITKVDFNQSLELVVNVELGRELGPKENEATEITSTTTSTTSVNILDVKKYG